MITRRTKHLPRIQHFDVALALPGSKSITNRALLLAALADRPSTVIQPLRSDDSEAFIDCLNGMGAVVNWSGADVVIEKPLPSGATGQVNCRDAGTAARFLPPAAAALASDIRFDASEQLCKRPLSDLLESIRLFGTATDPVDAEHLPFTVRGSGLTGGDIELSGSVSSQFLSGLLMSSPLAEHPVVLRVPALISRPYIDLTIAMMEAFGNTVERNGYEEFRVTELGGYQVPKRTFQVEADASTASYFFAMAAATESRLQLTNLRRSSLQGDIRFLDLLEQMGARVEDDPKGLTVTGTGQLRGVDVDMGDISDVMMTLACIAPLADGPTRIRNVAHARVKESDRIAAVVDGMNRLGISVEDGPDWLVIHPGAPKRSSIDTYEDHRIAMSFSVLGLATGEVEIENPGCVKKTCPEFFDIVDSIAAD